METRPRIGVDEWVARHGERTAAGPVAELRRRAERVPWWSGLGGFVVLVALVPALTSNEYVIRVGVTTLVFALLSLGLNVAVGFAGLLDLGYVAFFGFGAYGYALLSSDHYGIHLPAEASVIVVLVASALLGLLLGLPSRRLVGDYLAIVTLFFLQAFVVLTTNGSHVSFLGFTGSTDLTGGPNGIPDVDPFDLFGLHIRSIQGYFYVALSIFALAFVALRLVVRSRTGRAWKALREDPLAAELMGIPVNRLKLVAFMFGAAIGGVTGTIDAAVNSGVFPSNYDVPLLITIYAMLILGGVGSLPGAVLGAIVVNVSLEVLRDANQSRWLFYAGLLVTLVAKVRPWLRLALVVAALVGLGYAIHAIVGAVWPAGTHGEAAGGDAVARAVQSWVIHPQHSALQIGNYAFVALVLAALGLTLLRGLWRTVALVPALYLAAFVWENRLAVEPATTRFLLLGALLVVLMAARPQGLLGSARVEIA
jgi:branched-chain amino acid transport system permease protein